MAFFDEHFAPGLGEGADAVGEVVVLAGALDALLVARVVLVVVHKERLHALGGHRRLPLALAMRGVLLLRL